MLVKCILRAILCTAIRTLAHHEKTQYEQQINYNALKLLACLSTFAGLLGQEILVDVGENTTLCDCDMSEKSGC